jgi:hypothetical protein
MPIPTETVRGFDCVGVKVLVPGREKNGRADLQRLRRSCVRFSCRLIGRGDAAHGLRRPLQSD